MQENISFALEQSETNRFERIRTFLIKYTPAICSYLLAALFLYAAISKLWIYNGFVIQLTNSPMTAKYAHILAWLVPGLEILIAAMLIIPRTRLIGLYASFILMFAFTVFVYRILTNAELHSCGCGGIINNLNWRQHLWFNMFFTFLPALAVYILSQRKKDSSTA